MTVYRRNPLLMTVMGANPGPRRKRPVDDPVDHAIGQAWHRLMSGVQVSIMDIPKIFRDVKLEMAAGMPLEEAVMRVGSRFQVNRNPSLAASLAGGLAGAFVTHAMSNPFHIRPMKKLRIGERVEVMHGSGVYSGQQAVVSAPFHWKEESGAYKPVPTGYVFLRTLNGTPFTMPRNRVRSIDPRTETMSNPGPSFVVIETDTGKVVYTKRATGMGNAAIDACFVKANYLSQKTGLSYIVFLDIRGLRVGMQVNVPMVRALGITGEVLPRPNPLNEAEHRQIVATSKHDMAMSRRYEEMGDTFNSGQYAGRSNRGREIAHNFSPRSNPAGVVFSTPAKLEAEKIAGWMNRAKGVHVMVEPMRGGEWGVKVPPNKFAVARRAFDRAIRMNPQANPGRTPSKRKITMTIEQFAKWVKAKRDPAMWRAFLAKFRGYEKWTHGAKSRKVVLEWQNVPGMDGLWITYDGGKQPESTYIMRKGSPRKGAWKHEWDTMPDIKHDPEAGLVLNKLRGKSRISDFYHK